MTFRSFDQSKVDLNKYDECLARRRELESQLRVAVGQAGSGGTTAIDFRIAEEIRQLDSEFVTMLHSWLKDK